MTSNGIKYTAFLPVSYTHLIEARSIPSIFVEANGSTNAAEIISRETGVKVYTLTTIMDGKADYFTAMRQNVEAVKEALS